MDAGPLQSAKPVVHTLTRGGIAVDCGCGDTRMLDVAPQPFKGSGDSYMVPVGLDVPGRAFDVGRDLTAKDGLPQWVAGSFGLVVMTITPPTDLLHRQAAALHRAPPAHPSVPLNARPETG
jgi:hypothetical protein